jgi:hypothetical protein
VFVQLHGLLLDQVLLDLDGHDGGHVHGHVLDAGLVAGGVSTLDLVQDMVLVLVSAS